MGNGWMDIYSCTSRSFFFYWRPQTTLGEPLFPSEAPATHSFEEVVSGHVNCEGRLKQTGPRETPSGHHTVAKGLQHRRAKMVMALKGSGGWAGE